jgi:hypothetical protein
MFEFFKKLFKKNSVVEKHTVDEILVEQKKPKTKVTKKPALAGLENEVVKKRRGRPPKVKS